MKYESWLGLFNFFALCFWLFDSWWWAPRRLKKRKDEMVEGILEELKKSDQIIFVTPDKHIVKIKDEERTLQ
jgi:hypothetical protein